MKKVFIQVTTRCVFFQERIILNQISFWWDHDNMANLLKFKKVYISLKKIEYSSLRMTTCHTNILATLPHMAAMTFLLWTWRATSFLLWTWWAITFLLLATTCFGHGGQLHVLNMAGNYLLWTYQLWAITSCIEHFQWLDLGHSMPRQWHVEPHNSTQAVDCLGQFL